MLDARLSGRELIEIRDKNLFFLDVVRGLKQEAERVLRAVNEVQPDILALSISQAEVKALEDYVKIPYKVEMSRYEELYARLLSKFGDVYLPPPCYLAGLEAAEKNGLRLVGIDMDDEAYTTAYCAFINGRELFVHSMRLGFLKMRSFKADNPWDFAIQWDKRINNLRGFRQLEKEREKYMAEELRKLALTGKRIMAILDVERADGVRRLIQGWE